MWCVMLVNLLTAMTSCVFHIFWPRAGTAPDQH